MKELRTGCKRLAPAKAASVSSTGEISPCRILGANSEMVIRDNSSLDTALTSFVGLEQTTGKYVG